MIYNIVVYRSILLDLVQVLRSIVTSNRNVFAQRSYNGAGLWGGGLPGQVLNTCQRCEREKEKRNRPNNCRLSARQRYDACTYAQFVIYVVTILFLLQRYRWQLRRT